ncbi:MAG: HD domain-containing protein [Planctomycetales bacterium]|nr:HD domain-containing protein [Planctomycetales bacterium]
MTRQNISALQPRDSVDEIYRVADKQLRTNRQGSDYILLQLMDRTGQISGLRWNVGQSIYESFQKGDFLRLVGTCQLHNGILQLIVQDFEPVPATKVRLEDFSQSDPQELQSLVDELRSRLTSFQNEHLKCLANAYLGDGAFVEKLSRAPAGIKTHHAFEGGLLRHIVDLMRVADSIAPLYPQLDEEILRMGVFLHDLGKLEELSFDGDMTYTDAGQLVGHLVQGVVELQQRVREIELSSGSSFPETLLWRLQHMIVSHHGKLEHGSPKVPMTIEAIVLHFIDDLDAKVNAATDLIDADRNTDSNWTTFFPVMGCKLFKPSSVRPAN